MTMTMDDDGAILVHLTNPGGIVGGSGVANQIAYWSGANSIGGDAGLTYNTATDTLSLANSLTFTGATGVNDTTVPDNLADALSLDDAGGLNYLQIVSTNTQPVVRWNSASADIDFHISTTGEADALFVRGSDGNVGIGTASPDTELDVNGDITTPGIFAHSTDERIMMAGAESTAAGAYVLISAADRANHKGSVTFWANTSEVWVGNNDHIVSFGQYDGSTWSYKMVIDRNGNVGIGINTALAQLHVSQPSASGAEPVLYLHQADASEEMVRFACVIGAGNSIEAVGGKTLTTTHFIKVTLPGGLTRYIPVGTIA